MTNSLTPVQAYRLAVLQQQQAALTAEIETTLGLPVGSIGRTHAITGDMTVVEVQPLSPKSVP